MSRPKKTRTMATIDAVAELSTSGCYGPSAVRPAALVAPGLRAGYSSKEFPAGNICTTARARALKAGAQPPQKR